MLENATPRTDVFEAPGLLEQTIAEGSENATLNPMRVYVAPGGTVHIRVSADRLNREPGTDASGAQTSHLFCLLHKGEKAFRSQIQIVPSAKLPLVGEEDKKRERRRVQRALSHLCRSLGGVLGFPPTDGPAHVKPRG